MFISHLNIVFILGVKNTNMISKYYQTGKKRKVLHTDPEKVKCKRDGGIGYERYRMLYN